MAASQTTIESFEAPRPHSSPIEARLQLAAIVDSSDDAIISKDLTGIITSWNAAASRIFGYQPEEIIGRSVLTLIPDERHSEEPEILRKVTSGQRIEHFETRRRRKDGQLLDVSLTISPIRDASGRIIGISKIARDITERKRAEAALFQSERMAAVGRLAATIAHEVNNPLEAILNLGYLLTQNPTLDSDGRELAELLVGEVLRLSEITRQTLSFYCDNASAAPVELAGVLDGILRLLQTRLEQRSVRVHTRYQAGARVLALPGDLRQIFTNLILNSIEALPPSGGNIWISVGQAHDGSHASITIADNGPGIPPEIRRRIFEPFFSTKTGKGTGLGLWITQGIVRKYGGATRLRSWCTPGRPTGTAFRVRLPNRV